MPVELKTVDVAARKTSLSPTSKCKDNLNDSNLPTPSNLAEQAIYLESQEQQ